MQLRPVLVGAVLCGLAASPFVAQAAVSKPALPAFTPPLALAGGGGEPSIRVAPDGRSAAYVSAPAALGSNFWRVDQVRNPNGTYSMVGSKPQQPDLGTGGGDSEISLSQVPDPKTGCATIAYSGLHNIDLLDNFTTAVSTDCGKTFSTPNLYATQNTLTDRQWQVFDGAKTNHLLYHKVDTGQIVDSVSYDGGQTYLTLGTPAGATGVVDPAHSYTLQNVKIGNVVVDRHRATGATYPISGEKVHTLYAVFNGVRDATDAALAQPDQAPGQNYDHLDTVYVGRSDDGGLTWTDTMAYTTNSESRRELDLIFPVVDVDQAGNVYAAWTDGNRVEYVVSTDGAQTWSKPYLVNPGEAGAKTKNGTADIFPWIAAGANGNLDVVWYHGQGGNTTGYRQVGDKDTAWTVAFAQLSHAAARAGAKPAPKVESRSLAVTPVMHRGNVCNNGTTCLVDETLGNGGDRTLLDFFQVAIDKAGRANIAYADDATSPGSSTIKYTRQNTGRSLTTGKPLQGLPFVPLPVKQLGTSCPGPQVVDKAGDAAGSATTGTPTLNDDTLDVRDVRFATTPTGLKVTLHAKNLSALPAPGAAIGNLWRVTWSMGRRSFYLIAASNGPGLQTFEGGEVVAGADTAGKGVTGTLTEGPNGAITWTVPKAAVGSPARGTVLTNLAAETHGSEEVNGTGAYFTAAVDRAPDVGAGAPFTVGRC